jgi:hypothetical protein
MRRRQITAYGDQLDQDKLTVLAEQESISASTWLVRKIREDYDKLYGDADPAILRKFA